MLLVVAADARGDAVAERREQPLEGLALHLDGVLDHAVEVPEQHRVALQHGAIPGVRLAQPSVLSRERMTRAWSASRRVG